MSASRLIYLHGFRSSPLSFKARMIHGRMQAAGLADRYLCPQLPPSPREAMALVFDTISPTADDALIGSSLGGFYATWIAERVGCRAVLLNPAIMPAAGLRAHLGPQTQYHSDDAFELLEAHLDEMRALEVSAISRPERYFLVAATGDELLDWRDMVAHYPGALHRVVTGSDHGLSDFDQHIDAVLAFTGIASSSEKGLE